MRYRSTRLCLLLGFTMFAASQASGQSLAPPPSPEVAPIVVTAPRLKLPTDEPLRAGMVGVQNALFSEYYSTCAQGPSNIGYARLATALDQQSSSILKLSHVSAQSRAQVEILMQHLNSGAALLRSADDPRAGVSETIAVLIAYSTEFDHAGWRPQGSSKPKMQYLDRTDDPRASVHDAVTEAKSARDARHEMCRLVSEGNLQLWGINPNPQ